MVTRSGRERAFVEGKPVGSLTREAIVDNITMYWLTGTGRLSRAVVLGVRGRQGRPLRRLGGAGAVVAELRAAFKSFR